MAKLEQLTTNRNFLSPIGFRLVLTRLPNVILFSQSATLPSVGIKEITVPNPILPLNVSSTTMDQGTFSITFKVDEDLVNYKELYQWMIDLTFDRETSLYLHMGQRLQGDTQTVRSDATLTILNSAKNANKEIQFTDCFPRNLTPLVFDTRKTDVDYIECTATFSFRNFSILN